MAALLCTSSLVQAAFTTPATQLRSVTTSRGSVVTAGAQPVDRRAALLGLGAAVFAAPQSVLAKVESTNPANNYYVRRDPQ
jgi:hypothetical protein